MGYPIGGKGSQNIVLELHYDNPNLDSGMVDNFGLELLYVHKEPESRAGLLTFGQLVSSAMTIPPRANNYVTNGSCPQQCTEEVR